MKAKVLYYETKLVEFGDTHYLFYFRMSKINQNTEKNWIPCVSPYTLEMACFNSISDGMINFAITKIYGCYDDANAVRESINQFDKFIVEMKDKLEAGEVEQRR